MSDDRPQYEADGCVIINERTRTRLEELINQQSLPIALVGPEGAGKATLARYVAGQIVDDNPVVGLNVLEYHPDTPTTMSIETIRRIRKDIIKKHAESRSTAGHTVHQRRVLVLFDAHKMSDEAQNALLKTLEDFPENNRLILTIGDSERVLDTVWSRVARVDVLPLTDQQLQALRPRLEPAIRQKALHLSRGYPGLFCALVDDTDHQLLQELDLAKKLLSSSFHQRLLEIDTLRNDVAKTMNVLTACKLLLRYKLSSSPDVRLTHKLDAVLRAEEDLRRRVNTRLVLTDLFMKV